MTDRIVHAVLFRFRDHATEDERASALESLQALGEACGGARAGLLFWSAQLNLDQRKSWHVVEIGIFRDRAAFDAFRRHPEHVTTGQRLAALADWAVGDLAAPAADLAQACAGDQSG